MRRALLAILLTATVVPLTACSSSLFGGDTTQSTASPTATRSGPLPTSQRFDQPFPVAGDAWDATVTLSDLRIVPSRAGSDPMVVVGVRAVQSSGEPTISPEDFTAFDPAGRPFERVENPAGTVPDPLVPTVMTSPGQEINGMVAWTMPQGARVGRIDMVTPGTISSAIVTRQPVDPMATQPTSPST